MFGPVMVIWFITIGAIGFSWIVTNPHVLSAINPMHAVTFFEQNRYHGFVVLGAVFLVVTGGEALYADMGHFGAVSDPPGVVRDRHARPAAELLRPGRAAPARTRPRSTRRSSISCRRR